MARCQGRFVALQHGAARYGDPGRGARRVPALRERTVATLVVKKYGNRRLYDTGQSKYITLEELAETIRKGSDVQVLDAKTGQDLTQPTLTQIIVESRGAARLLPVPLLLQLIRMREDALAEFMGRWMTWALAVYTQARRGATSMAAYNPLAMAPFAATNALARLFNGPAAWSEPEPLPPPPPEAAPEPVNDDVAQLRRELDDLKRSLQKKRR
jgi:polyhydroxyalkanoate synthesis repressor PhaR